MEGTNLSASHEAGTSEKDLEEALATHINKASGLVFGIFSPLHLDRLKSFINASHKAGRTFVADLYTAYVMHMFQREGVHSPAVAGAFRIFFNEAGLNKISRSKLLPDFKRNQITREELLRDRAKYVLPARLSTFELDFPDIPQKSTFIYSLWKGYLDQPEWRKLKARVRSAQSTFIHCHTSGHIYRSDMESFIRSLRPRYVVPIHTAVGEAFRQLPVQTLLVQDHYPVNVSLIDDLA